MDTNIKNKAHKKFSDLEQLLLQELAGKKGEIISIVNQAAGNGSEKEGIFIKKCLYAALSGYYKDKEQEICVEGINSGGKAQYKNNFFNSKPAPDFIVLPGGNNKEGGSSAIVGEIKYQRLTFRSFVHGLGQVIGYIKASQFEITHYPFGCYIFFDVNVAGRSISEKEKTFISEVWEKENIYAIVI